MSFLSFASTMDKSHAVGLELSWSARSKERKVKNLLVR